MATKNLKRRLDQTELEKDGDQSLNEVTKRLKLTEVADEKSSDFVSFNRSIIKNKNLLNLIQNTINNLVDLFSGLEPGDQSEQ